MQLLDLTLDTPAENLALDEALLLAAEAAGQPQEVLRLWEPRQFSVVIGSSSRIANEVALEACRARGIEVMRRTSGGAAVAIGPGCLMYSLVLSRQLRPEQRAIDPAHRFALDAIVGAIGRLVPGVVRRGTSDLAIGDRKFSGNSLRMKREHLLYHGTLLYDFPLDVFAACLATPPRQPAYRHGRAHNDFVTNLPIDAGSLRSALIAAFDAHEDQSDWPRKHTIQLATEKYAIDAWTHRF
ncbi:MAG TPA: lipoate--protein ligase family protein [Pirellulales bacterium]|nr:lipoate--protein ligase family protein [Pirellulales bacterium]